MPSESVSDAVVPAPTWSVKPSESASTKSVPSIEPLLSESKACASAPLSAKSLMPSLSESRSMTFAMPSASVSNAVVPAPTWSVKPSESTSTKSVPSIEPLLSVSRACASAPLSTRSLMPSLSESKSR